MLGKQIIGWDPGGVAWYELMKILLFNGLKGDLRPGPKGNMGHVVRLKLEAQMCPDITGPYIYIYILRLILFIGHFAYFVLSYFYYELQA